MSVFHFVVFLFFPCKLVLVLSEQAELPSRITALIGSCVQIPCTFDAPNDILNEAESIFGIWVKTDHRNPDHMVFNGSTNITKGFSRIEILGDLRQRNCTTVFYDVMTNHTDNYYFRVEIQPGDWKYTYSSNPIYISVSDVPEPPILNQTDLKAVMEGRPVTLICSAEAPCPKQPPTISWSHIPESAHITTQIQEKPDKTQSVFSQMSFNASYRDHRKSISCTATYPRTPNDSTVETTVTLQILFPPKETHVFIDAFGSVSLGTNVTLTCKTKANPSNNISYSWYKRGREKQLGFGDQLSFIVKRRSGGLYSCAATTELGTQTSEEIQVIVAESLTLIVGCVGGVASFLFLFLLISIFIRVQRVKASIIRDTDDSDQIDEKQVQISSVCTNSAFVTDEEPEMKDEDDTVQYEDIDMSASQNPVNSSGQETIYAEVCSPQEEQKQD